MMNEAIHRRVFRQLNNVSIADKLEALSICQAHIDWLIASCALLADDKADFAKALGLLAADIRRKEPLYEELIEAAKADASGKRVFQ